MFLKLLEIYLDDTPTNLVVAAYLHHLFGFVLFVPVLSKVVKLRLAAQLAKSQKAEQ